MNSRRLANAPALSESVSVSGSLYRPAVQLCTPEGPLEKQQPPPPPTPPSRWSRVDDELGSNKGGHSVWLKTIEPIACG